MSIRGLFLLNGHFEDARSHIIAFGSCLRHGLIPNLLDRGLYPRYNARDASWWWLWAVQEYCRLSPEGLDFLGVLVHRRFTPCKRYQSGPTFGSIYNDDLEPPNYTNLDSGDVFLDPSDPRVYKHQSTIAQICHEILERHGRGIEFREWNAGPKLDHAMSDVGFDVKIGTRFEDGTGFVFGGNKFNCGTWMDKMGDSEKAGTKGRPATPRDGSPVEIIGLCKATLRWVSRTAKTSPHWKWDHIVINLNASDKKVAYSDWNNMIQASFEKCFFIPLGKLY
jgi:glycogen debranching enzyme